MSRPLRWCRSSPRRIAPLRSSTENVGNRIIPARSSGDHVAVSRPSGSSSPAISASVIRPSLASRATSVDTKISYVGFALIRRR